MPPRAPRPTLEAEAAAPTLTPIERESEAASLPFHEGLEESLLRRVRSGSEEALEELLLSAEPRLMAICLRMARDPQEARDLCQDALVKIIAGLPGFGGRSKLSTWMIRVTMNVCLTDRRRGRLRRAASLDSGPPGLGDGGSGSRAGQGRSGLAEDGRSLGASLKDEREPPAPRRVEELEERRRLAAGIARITPEQRALLILRDAQGLDYAQIAEIVNIPVGTVKSRLFRARVALREEIEKSPGS